MRSGWEFKSIDEVAFVGRGKSRHRPRNDPALYGGNHPFIQTAEIHNSDLWITCFEKTYSDYGLAQSKLWEPGTVCITNAGENTGDCAILGIKACFPDSVIAIVPDDGKADGIFLKYAIDLLKPQIRRVTKGATQDNLSVAKLLSYKIPMPPLIEQKKIGGLLKQYGLLIENNRRRIQLLEESALLLYKEWFARLRFPGHEHLKVVDGVPKGWEKKYLGEIVTIKKGKNITKDVAKDGDVPVVAGGLSPAYYHDISNALAPAVTISASGANAGFVNYYLRDIWASDCSYISSSFTETIFYFYLLLKCHQKEITGLQRGAAQPHVYPKDLQRLFVLSPPQQIALLFESSVAHFFEMVSVIQRQNIALTKARDLLLPRLMNGEMAV